MFKLYLQTALFQGEKLTMMFSVQKMTVSRVTLPSSCELWEHHLCHFEKKQKKNMLYNWGPEMAG